jgi:hypothetical protein
MSERDPFELLARVNPLRDLDEVLPSDATLLAEILAGTTPTVRGRSRSRWIASGTALVIVAAAAAYAFARSEHAHDPTTVTCFSNAARDPDSQFALGPQDDPLAACRQLWETGQLGTGDVPPLTACVTDTGIVAIVPGDLRVCTELGYAQWNGKVDPEAQALLSFRDELDRTFGRTCYPPAAAARIVTDHLSQHHLEGWTVSEASGFNEHMPCTVGMVDLPSKTITLVARPRTSGDQSPEG